ncbi:MAG: indole-3-glycerol phosphate synthase TrpC [bacterium]
MQAFSRWTPPTGVLGQIVKEAEARAEALHARAAMLEEAAALAPAAPSLRAALRRESVGLLAEVKRRSPSKGSIAEGLDATDQARAYQQGGAAGLSILTEPAHFGGSVDDLRNVRAVLGLPLLKKDFHVAPIQLLEARVLGASAALLIARALPPDQLAVMMRVGASLGLELLVEVRDEAELAFALGEGASMVGVNNRDLETLRIDPATGDRLIPMIPADVVAIAESGVNTRADVERYAAVGADAVLVGSSLSAAHDPVSATRVLTGVPRRTRAG